MTSPEVYYLYDDSRDGAPLLPKEEYGKVLAELTEMIALCEGIEEDNLFECMRSSNSAFHKNYYSKYRVQYVKTHDLKASDIKAPHTYRGVDIHHSFTKATVKSDNKLKNITVFATFLSNFAQKADIKLAQRGDACYKGMRNSDPFAIGVLKENLEALTGETYMTITDIYHEGKVHPLADLTSRRTNATLLYH